jgi:hypothetical protein
MPQNIHLKTKKEIWAERKQKKIDDPQEQREGKNNFQPLIWTAPEFTKHKKDAGWFITGGIIALALLIFALYSKNFLFALIIILSAFSVFIWSQKEPRKIKFSITPRGIAIGKTIYNFDNLESFWVFYDPPEIKYLSIISKKIFMPKIAIPLGSEDPNEIREILIEFLPEKEQHESLIDVLGRHLRY